MGLNPITPILDDLNKSAHHAR